MTWLLDYCKDTFYYKEGKLYYLKWIKGISKDLVDKPAGNLHPLGYRAIKIKGRIYREHLLVWLMFHGTFPENEIDHINNVYSDNRIENLRESSRSENCCNRHGWSKYSNFKGVSPNKRGKPWEARITINKQRVSLGTFETEEAAARAYDIAALKNNSDFAKTNFPKEEYNELY